MSSEPCCGTSQALCRHTEEKNFLTLLPARKSSSQVGHGERSQSHQTWPLLFNGNTYFSRAAVKSTAYETAMTSRGQVLFVWPTWDDAFLVVWPAKLGTVKTIAWSAHGQSPEAQDVQAQRRCAALET
eukprot:4039885-Pleurochrysis_carterae.AAC.2